MKMPAAPAPGTREAAPELPPEEELEEPPELELESDPLLFPVSEALLEPVRVVDRPADELTRDLMPFAMEEVVVHWLVDGKE